MKTLNYPKKGLFIKPESEMDSEIILVAMSRHGLFPLIENDGIFIGDAAHPPKMQEERLNQLLEEVAVKANVHIAEPLKDSEINPFND